MTLVSYLCWSAAILGAITLSGLVSLDILTSKHRPVRAVAVVTAAALVVALVAPPPDAGLNWSWMSTAVWVPVWVLGLSVLIRFVTRRLRPRGRGPAMLRGGDPAAQLEAIARSFATAENRAWAREHVAPGWLTGKDLP